MSIARWGIGSLVISLFVLLWFVWLMPAGPIQWLAIALALFLWFFSLAFFRNPLRVCAGGPLALSSPADGTITDVSEHDSAPWAEATPGKHIRVGIFLSVFDVHVNRSPIQGKIVGVDYHPGLFLDARHSDASLLNESNTLIIEADPSVMPGLRVVVRQISGLIARRIVCTHGIGESLQRGELYGMIKFGSRTELWIPAGQAHRVLVQVGQKVQCGGTVLLELAKPADAAR